MPNHPTNDLTAVVIRGNLNDNYIQCVVTAHSPQKRLGSFRRSFRRTVRPRKGLSAYTAVFADSLVNRPISIVIYQIAAANWPKFLQRAQEGGGSTRFCQARVRGLLRLWSVRKKLRTGSLRVVRF